MPHIDVKYFPRDISDAEKQEIAEEMCAVLKKHFQTKDSSLSVTMAAVDPDSWKDRVYDQIIESPALVKKPGYQM